MTEIVVTTHAPDETRAVAAVLAELVRPGDVIVLTGDLGAGKTCFAQGLGRGLGIDEPITSPTFTLANQYQGRLLLHHLDVYRLDDLSETLDLDLPELLETGVTVIEWGEQIDTVLPTDRLVVRLLLGDGDDDRRLHFESSSSRWDAALSALGPVLGGDQDPVQSDPAPSDPAQPDRGDESA